jgi:amino acid transporter
MEQTKPISHFVAGIIIAAIMVIFSLVMNFTGQEQNKALGWFAYAIFIVALVIFIKLYGKSKNYTPTFGNLFSYGFKITSIVTLIVILFLVVFFIAFPEYKDKMLDASRQAIEERDQISDEQIDQTLSMMSKNFILFAAGGALFMYLILGAIGSLIGAAITKKQPHNPLDQLST